MNVKQKFLELTSRTYPHGTEEKVYNLLGIEDILTKDSFGNLFIRIGESDVMFTSHLDTATSALTKVNHVFDKNIIKTDNKSILGADDKAGVTVMLYMIEKNVPGLYYFFLGEEVGCLGSKKVAKEHKIKKDESINKVVSFDRRGTSSVITYQSSSRCASDEFGKALSKEFNRVESTFNYDLDTGGVLTDSVQFTSIYPECTNISVGYYKEHTFRESQDIKHLEKLAIACTKIDWNSLPVKRDPSEIDYLYSGYGRYYDDWDDYYDDYDNFKSYGKKKKDVEVSEKIWFEDKDFFYIGYVDIDNKTGKYLEVDLVDKRINKEKNYIKNFFKSIDLVYHSFEWDGMNLNVKINNSGHKNSCDRNELMEFIPELKYENIGKFDYDD